MFLPNNNSRKQHQTGWQRFWKKDSMSRWMVGGLILLVLVVANALKNAQEALSFPTPGESVTIVVEPGSSVGDVAQELERQQVIDSPFWFKAFARLTGRARTIQAGTVEVASSFSFGQLLDALSKASVPQTDVTIVEGMTLAEVDARVVSQGIGAEGDVLRFAMDETFRSEWEFLSQIPDGLDVEGYVFPDTYRVYADATAEDVLRKALREFDERVARAKAEDIEQSGSTLFEIITIASILEREVQRPEDMRQVSDIIRKRLRDGMPLQMDSTVNYVTGKNHPGILLSDRDVDSPYNTYLYAGLPVGPISNPGEAAIDAALHPTANAFYYFLTTPEGDVVYARTNEEHAANKAVYLR